MDIDRPIASALDVVFAGPLQLDRNAGGAERFGNRYRLDNVIGCHIGAPAEAAAGKQGVDLDLFGFETGGRRRIGLIDGLELIAGPDLAAVGVELDYGVERLHWRVRQRKLVARRQRLGGALKCRGDVTIAAGRKAWLFGELAVLAEDGGRAALLRLAVIPFDLERVAALLGRPEAVGDDGNAARHLHHVNHARHPLGGGGVERFYYAAKPRRTLQQRDQHVRESHVDSELRSAVSLPRQV